MQILGAILFLLATAWLLWLWTVADSHEIKWMRKWSSILFVASAIVISIGGTAVVTKRLSEASHRRNVAAYSVAIESRLREGDREEVVRQLQRVIDPPEEWSNESGDVLIRMSNATESLLSKPDSGTLKPANDHPVVTQPSAVRRTAGRSAQGLQ